MYRMLTGCASKEDIHTWSAYVCKKYVPLDGCQNHVADAMITEIRNRVPCWVCALVGCPPKYSGWTCLKCSSNVVRIRETQSRIPRKDQCGKHASSWLHERRFAVVWNALRSFELVTAAAAYCTTWDRDLASRTGPNKLLESWQLYTVILALGDFICSKLARRVSLTATQGFKPSNLHFSLCWQSDGHVVVLL